MENINVGVVTYIISNILKENYFNNNLINESKQLVNELFDIINESPILQLEFSVYNNIENKYIDNELMASRYIDNNIKLFEIYTIDEINDEHDKLKNIINETPVNIEPKTNKLHESINELIKQSIDDYENIDVDKLHESFSFILNHIMKPKNQTNSNSDVINEDVIEIAVDKFNEKFSVLNEDERNLFNKLINYNMDEKQSFFNTLKTETISLLEDISNNEIVDKVNTAITTLNETKCDSNNIDDNIIKLFELNKSIIQS